MQTVNRSNNKKKWLKKAQHWYDLKKEWQEANGKLWETKINQNLLELILKRKLLIPHSVYLVTYLSIAIEIQPTINLYNRNRDKFSIRFYLFISKGDFQSECPPESFLCGMKELTRIYFAPFRFIFIRNMFLCSSFFCLFAYKMLFSFVWEKNVVYSLQGEKGADERLKETIRSKMF